MAKEAKAQIKTSKKGNLVIREGVDKNEKPVKQVVLTVAPSKLTDDDMFWLDRYENKGFDLVEKRKIENPRNHKEKWFKEHCTEEEFKKFQLVKKEGFTSASKKDKDTGELKFYKPCYAAAVNWFYEQHPELEPEKEEE